MSRSFERLDFGLMDVKLAPSPTDMSFSGYGAVFGNIDSYGDTIQKGAFAKTIHDAKTSNQWPAMLEQHGGWGMSASDMTPIGVWTDLEEDDVGLKVAGKFAPTPRGMEMHALMKMTPRPAINGLSIGFLPIKWKMRSNPEEPRRTLEEIKLMEISPVTFPANGKARVGSVKSGDCTEREFERLLTQDAGFSRSHARIIINEGFKAFAATQDAGEDVQALMASLKQRQIYVPA